VNDSTYTLKYRHLRDDMIEVLKTVNKYHDVCAAVKLNFNTLRTTRGNKYKFQKSARHYYLRKFSICSRVVNIWNSLPDSVVDADTLNIHGLLICGIVYPTQWLMPIRLIFSKVI